MRNVVQHHYGIRATIHVTAFQHRCKIAFSNAIQCRGGIGCDHLKLGDSNLKGSESLAAMASVAQVLNQLEVDIVEIE